MLSNKPRQVVDNQFIKISPHLTLLRDLLFDLSLFFSLEGDILFLSFDRLLGDLDLRGDERLGLERRGDRDLLRLLGEGDRLLWTGDLRRGEGDLLLGDLDRLLGLFDLLLGERETLRFLLLSGDGERFFFLDFALSF